MIPIRIRPGLRALAVLTLAGLLAACGADGPPERPGSGPEPGPGRIGTP